MVNRTPLFTGFSAWIKPIITDNLYVITIVVSCFTLYIVEINVFAVTSGIKMSCFAILGLALMLVKISMYYLILSLDFLKAIEM